MKRILALLLTVIILSAILCACGSSTDSTGATESAESNEKPTQAVSEAPTEPPTEIRNNNGDPFYGEDNITLTVWVSESAVDITKEMCNKFLELHPDKMITINVAAHEEGDVDSGLRANTGNEADVFSFGSDLARRLTEANLLAPVVSDYWEDVTAYHTERSVDSAMLDGKLIAYPETDACSYYLVYDKSVVSDTDAQTLEGVLEACRRSGKKFVIDAANGYYSCAFPFTGGLELNGMTEDHNQKFNDYDEEKVVDSLEAFSNLFSEYSDVVLSDNVDKIGSGMSPANGTVGAGIDGYWNAPTLQEVLDNNYGAAKLPTVNINGTDTQMVSMSGSKLIGVNAKSKFPESAQVLADYLAGYDCQNMRLTEMSWLPSIKELQSGDAVTGNAAFTALLTQSEYSVLQKDVADSFWSPMGRLGTTVQSGTADRTTLQNTFKQTIEEIEDY